MNRTRNILKGSRAPDGKTFEVKRNGVPEFPGGSHTPYLYIEEMHCRAELVTPILKEIPGYWPDYGKN